MLYELFRIPMGECDDTFDEALHEHFQLVSPEPNLWKVHEGFIAAEAKVLLPHIGKFRQVFFFFLTFSVQLKY